MRPASAILACALLVLSTGPAPAADPKAEHFANRVRPLLALCVDCHAGAEADGGLDLTTRAGALKGGKSGPALRPGDGADPPLRLLLQARWPRSRGEDAAEEAVGAPSAGVRSDLRRPRSPRRRALGGSHSPRRDDHTDARRPRLVVPATGEATDSPPGQGRRLKGTHPGRRLHPVSPGAGRPEAAGGSRPGNAPSARDVRLARTAADTRGNRRLRQRQGPGRLGQGDRAAAGLASLRRCWATGNGSDVARPLGESNGFEYDRHPRERPGPTAALT